MISAISASPREEWMFVLVFIVFRIQNGEPENHFSRRRGARGEEDGNPERS